MAQYTAGAKSPDGITVGQSTSDKIGFYGTSPIVRPVVTAVTTAAATTALNETRIARLYAALEAIGIIETAAP